MSTTTDKRPGAGMLRVPPMSIEAEQSVLGGVLLDNQAFDKAAAILTEDDFYRREHQEIWSAISGLVMAGHPADVITVFEALERAGLAEDVGGLSYLNALATSVPSASNITRYAQIVRDRAMLRRTVSAADEIGAEAFEPKAAPGPVIERGIRRLEEIEARGRVGRVPKHIGQVMVGCLDRLQAIADGSMTSGWATGLPRTDEVLGGGLKGGDVVVLAARPSVGKSSMAQALLGYIAANDGVAVLEFSQEMPEWQCGNRAISNIGRVDYGRLTTGKLHDEDWGRVADAVDRAKNLPWWIDDQPGLRLSEIRAKTRLVVKEAAALGLKLGVVVIDYVQLCASDEDLANRNLELAAISTGLKNLAKELDLCVVLLSQLNREVEKRPGQEPIMSDLRDSGGLEQDADVIGFLWPIGERDSFGNRTVGWKLAKNRNGDLLRMCLHFEGRTQRWGESTLHPDAAMKEAAKARQAVTKGQEV